MIVYKATNKVNGKIYVGQTVKSLNKRISEHLNDDRTPFQMALKKYGIEYFDFCIQDECQSKAELNEKEKYWISFFNSKSPNGYNLTDGGEGIVGCKMSDEAIRKMSLAKKGKSSWNKGLKLKPWSPDIRERIIKGMKERYSKTPHHMNGKNLPQEVKEKISKSNKGKNVGEKNGMFGKATGMKGKCHREESKAKDSKSKKENWKDPEYRKKIIEARKGERYSKSMSAARFLIWQDPEYRKKQFESHRKYFEMRKGVI